MVILNENISRNSGQYIRPISIKACILKMADGPFAEEERLNWKKYKLLNREIKIVLHNLLWMKFLNAILNNCM